MEDNFAFGDSDSGSSDVERSSKKAKAAEKKEKKAKKGVVAEVEAEPLSGKKRQREESSKAASSAGTEKSTSVKEGSKKKASRDLDGEPKAVSHSAAAAGGAGASSSSTAAAPAVGGAGKASKKAAAAPAASAVSEKSAGKPAKPSLKEAGDSEDDEESDPKGAAPLTAPEELATAFWKGYRKCLKDLTDIEAGEPLAASCFRPVCKAGSVSDVSSVARAVKQALPGWKGTFGWKHGMKKRPSGAPALVIITYSARRAADMLKPLATFKTRIAKLFAKHLTVEEQEAILAGPPVTIAVGTANRLQKLVERGSLSLDRLECVMLDTHGDSKGFGLLDHHLLSKDVFDFLKQHVMKRLAEGKSKMALYGS